VLGSLEEAHRPLSEDELRQYLIDTYVNQNEATKRRLNEQIRTGFVQKVEAGYELTTAGKRFVSLCRFLSVLFGLDRRFIEPQQNYEREQG